MKNKDCDELLQEVALTLDLANMELQTIDEVLARRPALAALKHRTEKIEHMCRVNGQLLTALKAALALFDKNHALSRFNWGASGLRAEDIRELNELPGTIRAAIAKAEGQP